MRHSGRDNFCVYTPRDFRQFDRWFRSLDQGAQGLLCQKALAPESLGTL